jgi:MFS family permease
MAMTRVFFGWWVAAAFSLMVFLSTGIRFAVGPFLKPMVADLGLDRASFSTVVALGLFLYGGFMPVVGRLVDRLGARAVTLYGALVLGGALMGTGLATRLWHLYLLYGVTAALGLAMTGHVVGSAVIARWFERRRGTALSMLGGASMAGISLLVPATMWLILRLGWRATSGVMGLAVILIVVPLAIWVVRDSPEAMGERPDGAPWASGAAADVEPRTSVGLAVQTLPFWQLTAGLFTCGFSMSLLSAHGVPMLTDHGYQPMIASGAFGVLGASSMICAIALGALSDRLGRRPVLGWLYGGRAVTFAAMFLVRDSPAGLAAVMLVGGATMSGSLAMTSALTAELFGRFSVGSVFGTIFLVHQAGAALGSWLAGVLFELSGGYGVAFAAACVMLLAAAAVSLTIDERLGGLPRPFPIAGGH